MSVAVFLQLLLAVPESSLVNKSSYVVCLLVRPPLLFHCFKVLTRMDFSTFCVLKSLTVIPPTCQEERLSPLTAVVCVNSSLLNVQHVVL